MIGPWFAVLLFVIAWFVTAVDLLMAVVMAHWWGPHSGGPGRVFHGYLGSACRRAFCTHLGSVSIGSVVMCLVSPLRFLAEFLDALSGACGRGRDGCFHNLFKGAANAVDCCSSMFRRDAVVMVAISGKPFFESAKKASRISQNEKYAPAMARTALTSTAILTLAKVFISLVVCIAGYLVIEHNRFYTVGNTWMPPVSSPLAPTAFIGVVAYAITTMYMDVFAIAIDAQMLAWLCEKVYTAIRCSVSPSNHITFPFF